MLRIEIPDQEWFNEAKNEFVKVKGAALQLEHSLVSVSKWEAKYKKPFLEAKDLSGTELIDYIKFMTITQNVKSEVYLGLTKKNFELIKDYISDKMTATWFKERKGGRHQIVTSELIYCWMTQYNIPFEVCQKWHLNRLLTLIRVCQEENSQKKDPRSKKEQIQDRKALNAARRKKYGTRG